MADFNLNLSDLEDSKSITSAMKRSFYPEGQQILKNTSNSQSNNFDRTLMSRDVVKIMQGDGLYRNPAFSLAGYEQNTKATMHTILAMGADIDDTVAVADPDDPSARLTGAQARLEIARKTIMSTGFAPEGFESSMRAFVSQSVGETLGGNISDGNSGSVTDSNGNSIPHSTAGYTTSDSAQVFNGGNRSIAFVDQLTDLEKQEYQKRAEKLIKKKNLSMSKQNETMIKNGFTIDFTKNRENQILKDLNFEIYQAGSYMQVKGRDEPKWEAEKLSKDLFGTGSRKVMISAALIELLDRLSDSIYINFDFDANRGILGPNFSPLTQENNSVTDHAFGRGIDIFHVGKSETSKIKLKDPIPPAATYMKALDIILQYVEALPQEIHPDLIVVSDQLTDQLGIVDGLESGTSAIRKKYPNLSKSLNFGSDASHRNHIHISFGSKRAGAILPASSFNLQEETSSESGAQATRGSQSVDKFKKSYTLKDGPLSDVDVFILLNEYGNFSKEISAIFTGIAHRESRFNPSSINTSGFWGLWQVATSPRAGGWVTAKFPVPTEEVLPFWKLGFANWKEMGINEENYRDFQIKYRSNDPNAGREYFDKRTFIPLNQVIGLRAKFNRKDLSKQISVLGKSKGTSILHPYGEGFLYFGWLSKVEWSIISNVYKKMTGKSPDDLSEWILKQVAQDSRTRNIDPETGKTILESWMNGKKYPIIYQKENPETKKKEYDPPAGWPKEPTPN